MKVLITGGAGFVGANLVRAFESRSDITEVVVLDDLSFGSESNLTGTRASLIPRSILDMGALDEATEGCSAIVHLAARASVPRSIREPLAAHETNCTGTHSVLEAARRHGNIHVILASSSSVYGATDIIPAHERLPTRPMSPYAATKLAAEAYALAWQAAYELPVLALRFFNVFGPFQSPNQAYAAVIPSFLSAALQDLPLPVDGDGSQCRDFTYVGSVVDIICEALDRRITAPEPVNLAFGNRITLLELIATIEELLDKPLGIIYRPLRPGDIPRSQADPTALRALFPGISPTPLIEGLESTIQWFQESQPWEQTESQSF